MFLIQLKLLGVSADHESITGEEVLRRLRLGYTVALRYSSIRPDLPHLIEEMLELGLDTFTNLMFTSDGPTPAFLEEGLINRCIEIAIEKGIPVEEAYSMGTYNPARHFHLDEQLGSIAPGRVAHINVLTEKENPHPIGVLAKGKWIVCDDKVKDMPNYIDWSKYGIKPLQFDWELEEKDIQFSMPMGLEMVNNVIVKPYSISTDVTVEEIPENRKDAFLLLMDRNGKWRVNTTIRGFTDSLGALATSFSSSGDLIFIGKSKKDMLLAWKRLKEIGGGIVLVHNGDILHEIPLPLGGIMSGEKISTIIKLEKRLKVLLKDFGYPYEDPIYNLLFLSATHLPYIRLTQLGIIDIKKQEVLFPSTMC